MSHYTVLVAARDPGDLDEILAPWDENKTVEPYRSYVTCEPADWWSVKDLRSEGLNPDDGTLTWAEVAAAHNPRHPDEELLLDDRGPYLMTAYNPESKWDWWQIGGRWAGYFPVKPGFTDGINQSAGRADGGLKAILDLAAMRDEAEGKARRAHRDYHALTGGTPSALPWKAFASRAALGREDGSYTIEQARRDYHEQPRVKALEGSEFRFRDDPIAEFMVTEDEHAARARASAVPGYALVTLDREWVAPGRMGWWAISDDEYPDRAAYNARANGYIEGLPGNVWLILVDAHI